VGVACGDVDSFQDDPQYKLMKYLVFGTILSSLLRLCLCLYADIYDGSESPKYNFTYNFNFHNCPS